MKEDEVLTQVTQLVKKEKDVKDYKLNEVKVSEYTVSVEYDLKYVLITNETTKTVEKEEIVVHNKVTHENKIIEKKQKE